MGKLVFECQFKCELLLISCYGCLTCSIFRYNFNKVAQYKQLTLEKEEEKMKNRKKTAYGYERWMMKAANNGAAAFGEVERIDDKDNVVGGGRGRRKTTGDDEEGNVSGRGEEVEEEEAERKNRLGLNKRSGGDDEEGPRGGDHDLDDHDIEKGKHFSTLYHVFI
jgi:transcription initiation factor TFIIF subunit alpha